MYLLVLFPLFITAWVLFSRYCFAQGVDHKPLAYFGIVFAAALVVTELVLGNAFSWLQFEPVSGRDLQLAGYWQHGLSALVPAAYLGVRRSRAPRDIALAVALWAVCNAVFITSVVVDARIDYPFDLEWLEGTMVDQTLVAKQGAIYAEPSPDFTPFLYGPAFFRALSVMPYMDESPFIWGRLLSLAMAGLIALLVYGTATLLAEDGWIGLLVGLGFLASNPFAGYWFDLYRIDTMFCFLLLLGGVLLWQRPKSQAATFAAGLSLALAVLTKQSAALMVLFFVLWFWVAHGWKRALWLVCFGAGSGVVFIGLELIISGTHFIAYYVEMVFGYPLQWKRVHAEFISRDLMAPPGILTGFLAVSGLVANFRRVGAKRWAKSMFPYLVVILALTSFFMRSKFGGWHNCRIPMIVAGLMGAAVWFGEHEKRPGPAGIYPGLILMVAYVWFMDPLGTGNRRQVPTKRDHATQQRLVEYLRDRPGKVWVSSHTHLCYVAKQQMCHNTMVVEDWYTLRGSVPDAFEEEMKSGTVSTIVLDEVPKWYKGPLRARFRSSYRCHKNKFSWAKTQGKPVTGWRTRPSQFCELKKERDAG